MRPSTMPKLSLTTLVIGARQLVVHEALETTVSEALYFSWLTPITYMGTASFGGAEIMTFLAPPFRCSSAFSFAVKTPVDSQTYVVLHAPQPIDAGSFSWKTRTA